MYVVGTHQKHPDEAFLMSTNNISFHGEIPVKKISVLASNWLKKTLSAAMLISGYFYQISSHSITHCRRTHTIYWKTPISILGTSSYEIYIFLEKNG